jgi:hypothetical protein
VYDIIHPERRNLTAIRGYKRIGGLPDDPHSDPQDRSWFGPHDRLFVDAEFDEMTFRAGPEHGKFRIEKVCTDGKLTTQSGVGDGTALVISTVRTSIPCGKCDV